MARIKVPTLETQRLVLRGWKRHDAAALYAYAKKPNVGPNAGCKPHADTRESRMIITQMFQQNPTGAVPPHPHCGLDGPEDVPIGSIGVEPDA